MGSERKHGFFSRTSSGVRLFENSKNLKDLYARKHGLSTEPVPVSAYVGSSKNLKDLMTIRSSHRRSRGAARLG